jgi:hypothetical protein
LDKPVRSIWLRQLPQTFKEGSVIDQMKIQLLKQALCLLQIMRKCLMAKDKKKKESKKVENEEEDKYNLDFDKLRKKDMIKIKRLFETL